MEQLAEQVRAGSVRAAARACRLVDDRAPGFERLLNLLFRQSGAAHVVGVTGNPGAGKSSLTDRLVQHTRARGQRVAVVAIDPTSPFTGGAILGDRIRMQQHFEDPEVFIRSLATRGALGGLSRSAADVVRVLEAWGAQTIFLETVGVGQDELEVASTAHTTLVVMAPGLGDDVQAIKAGILECADVFAVNKADREGADVTVRDLELMLALGSQALISATRGRGHSAAGMASVREHTALAAGDTWLPPIIKCVATRDQGLTELCAALDAHRTYLQQTEAGKARRLEREKLQLIGFLRDALAEAALAELGPELERAATRVTQRELAPYEACDQLMRRFRQTAEPAHAEAFSR